ncbi:MAG: trypsin-like peptidase domain-containing protein [Thermodesulfobacteriota bacterium]
MTSVRRLGLWSAGPALVIVLACSACFGEVVKGHEGIETKVLAVFATLKSNYYNKPWKSPDFRVVRGSGFFFRDEKTFPDKSGLILTNAHGVTQAQTIEVSNGREKRRYKADVVGICNSADFAVLQMQPEEFALYERRNGRVVPLELGDSDTLRVGDKVQGWGYPTGGQRISKSDQGEISRIEVSGYVYSKDLWLMVQASLQQNRGNSGGPVLKDNKVVGISFQGIMASDRINYFIPINLVKSLLPILDRQELIPKWRFRARYMFPRLKSYYGLGPEQGGILLEYLIPHGGPYNFGLRSNDILTEIDGHAVDDFGDIYFGPLDQKIYFLEILNRKRVGDPLQVKVIRNGGPLEIKGSVTPGLQRLVPRVFTTANYFIFGGVAFVELTDNAISDMGKPGQSLREKYLDEYPEKPDQKIVVVAEIFPEYGLLSAEDFRRRVEKIEDVEILNIAHLYRVIEQFRKEGKKKALLGLSSHHRLPLDIEGAARLDETIQKKYGILYMKTPGEFHK